LVGTFTTMTKRDLRSTRVATCDDVSPQSKSPSQ
jgi:hypothetical protein